MKVQIVVTRILLTALSLGVTLLGCGDDTQSATNRKCERPLPDEIRVVSTMLDTGLSHFACVEIDLSAVADVPDGGASLCAFSSKQCDTLSVRCEWMDLVVEGELKRDGDQLAGYVGIDEPVDCQYWVVAESAD
jgi:hypothetical protein